MNYTFAQLPEFEAILNAINPNGEKEAWMKGEIMAYIEMWKEEPDEWDDTDALISNIADETHDGAYMEEEDPTCFWDDDELEAFLIKYNIGPRNDI